MPGRASPFTAGRAVPKCADAITIARGLPRLLPKPLRKSRAGLSSIASVGEPWERNRVGNMNDLVIAYIGAHHPFANDDFSPSPHSCCGWGFSRWLYLLV